MVIEPMPPEDVVRSILVADAGDRAHDIAILAHPDHCADLKQRQINAILALPRLVPGLR
jgi:hypothetical protein